MALASLSKTYTLPGNTFENGAALQFLRTDQLSAI